MNVEKKDLILMMNILKAWCICMANLAALFH
jgi:hypothetical protein